MNTFVVKRRFLRFNTAESYTFLELQKFACLCQCSQKCVDNSFNLLREFRPRKLINKNKITI